jgi:mannosyl-oligosaccharide alpha-1,2-mannosidase
VFLLRTQNDSTIPGLWPEFIDASSVDGVDRRFAVSNFAYSIDALSDSTYEYLAKGHLLLGHHTDIYKTMWTLAARGIGLYLLYRPQLPLHQDRAALFSGIAIRHVWIGFARLPRSDDMAAREVLTNGWMWAYDTGPLGIMPEAFVALPCPVEDDTPCDLHQTTWEERSGCKGESCLVHGLPMGMVAVIHARYLLRPEAIDSVFYL